MDERLVKTNRGNLTHSQLAIKIMKAISDIYNLTGMHPSVDQELNKATDALYKALAELNAINPPKQKGKP